jgi:sugar phosphate isomerase/epimerase
MSKSIGAQLYTVRDFMQNPEQIEAALARIAEIGYKFVQLSGFAFEAVSIKALCDKLGLAIHLTHISPERILNDTRAVIAEHKIMDCPYIGLGGMPHEYRSTEGARKFLKDFTPPMQAFFEAGLKFQYHNHSFE